LSVHVIDGALEFNYPELNNHAKNGERS
jgi:hypothetical protein